MTTARVLVGGSSSDQPPKLRRAGAGATHEEEKLQPAVLPNRGIIRSIFKMQQSLGTVAGLGRSGF